MKNSAVNSIEFPRSNSNKMLCAKRIRDADDVSERKRPSEEQVELHFKSHFIHQCYGRRSIVSS